MSAGSARSRATPATVTVLGRDDVRLLASEEPGVL
jgi:hypothetical protein